uniref:CUB domain-containing protein n=1 Tax=Oryzias sinensis TaxID=183150 RepID=A0A8C7ZRV4_9TELE
YTCHTCSFAAFFLPLRPSGDGCGYTLLGAESGTLSSQNYPGTYPSNIWCRWRLRVPEGRRLHLLFGDFDSDSVDVCDSHVDGVCLPSGPLCGRLHATPQNVTLESNEATVTFRSGPHRSGRGFLISYATDLHPDLISCLQRGSHFSSQHLSVYCPAGCKSVTGDVWGNSELGYRDVSSPQFIFSSIQGPTTHAFSLPQTSVLCKSAVSTERPRPPQTWTSCSGWQTAAIPTLGWK